MFVVTQYNGIRHEHKQRIHPQMQPTHLQIRILPVMKNEDKGSLGSKDNE